MRILNVQYAKNTMIVARSASQDISLPNQPSLALRSGVADVDRESEPRTREEAKPSTRVSGTANVGGTASKAGALRRCVPKLDLGNKEQIHCEFIVNTRHLHQVGGLLLCQSKMNTTNHHPPPFPDLCLMIFLSIWSMEDLINRKTCYQKRWHVDHLALIKSGSILRQALNELLKFNLESFAVSHLSGLL